MSEQYNSLAGMEVPRRSALERQPNRTADRMADIIQRSENCANMAFQIEGYVLGHPIKGEEPQRPNGAGLQGQIEMLQTNLVRLEASLKRMAEELA